MSCCLVLSLTLWRSQDFVSREGGDGRVIERKSVAPVLTTPSNTFLAESLQVLAPNGIANPLAGMNARGKFVQACYAPCVFCVVLIDSAVNFCCPHQWRWLPGRPSPKWPIICRALYLLTHITLTPQSSPLASGCATGLTLFYCNLALLIIVCVIQFAPMLLIRCPEFVCKILVIVVVIVDIVSVTSVLSAFDCLHNGICLLIRLDFVAFIARCDYLYVGRDLCARHNVCSCWSFIALTSCNHVFLETDGLEFVLLFHFFNHQYCYVLFYNDVILFDSSTSYGNQNVRFNSRRLAS